LPDLAGANHQDASAIVPALALCLENQPQENPQANQEEQIEAREKKHLQARDLPKREI
jgi:hypothetical protein